MCVYEWRVNKWALAHKVNSLVFTNCAPVIIVIVLLVRRRRSRDVNNAKSEVPLSQMPPHASGYDHFAPSTPDYSPLPKTALSGRSSLVNVCLGRVCNSFVVYVDQNDVRMWCLYVYSLICGGDCFRCGKAR